MSVRRTNKWCRWLLHVTKWTEPNFTRTKTKRETKKIYNQNDVSPFAMHIQPANDIIHLLFMYSVLPAIFIRFSVSLNSVFQTRAQSDERFSRTQTTMQFSNSQKKNKQQQQKCWTYSVDVDVPADTWFKTQYRSPDDDVDNIARRRWELCIWRYATRHIIILWYIFRISVWCFRIPKI